MVSIVARVMAAQSKEGRAAVFKAPTAERLKLSLRLLLIVKSLKARDELRRKTLTIAPRLEDGVWVTRGRLAKGLPEILGVEKLPVLLPKSRLAELFMIQAHNENHEGPPGTLARCRAQVWIPQGRNLARKVARKCVRCRAAAAKVEKQRMGDLPLERCVPGSPPFTAICLDLLGPIMV